MDVDVDLSVVTEEVMETVFAGYDFTRTTHFGSTQEEETASSTAFQQYVEKVRKNTPERPTTGDDTGVLIIADIDKAADSHWIFRTQAGAWSAFSIKL